jgi:hypothetical protein
MDGVFPSVLYLKDSNGGFARVSASPFLDFREFGRSGSARETKPRANALAGRCEGFSTASKKLRHGQLFVSAEMIQDDRGG